MTSRAKLLWGVSIIVGPVALISAPATAQEAQTVSIGDSDIIVTAQKRDERLRDVPVPVTVVGADALLSGNEFRPADYASRVPGLTVTSGGSSSTPQDIAIRGITTGGKTNPTVGIVVDDVPFGSSTGLGGGNIFPELDPSDIARVEVLRGPQGALYGASSMGGLIKYVTVDPSTSDFSGSVTAGTSAVRNGDELGYLLRGLINVPLNSQMAIRASAFTRQDPGYIDNVVSGRDGVNRQRVWGGRLSSIFRSGDFSLKLSALYQRFRSDGLGESTQGLGSLEQDYILGAGPSRGIAQAYSAEIQGSLGAINITSITGYNVRTSHYTADETSLFGAATEAAYGVSGSVLETNNNIKKFSHETRFSGSVGDGFDWLLGGFFTNERSSPRQIVYAVDPSTGERTDVTIDLIFPNRYREYALFGNIRMRPFDRFEVQLGARQSWIRQRNLESTSSLPLFGLPTSTDPETRSRSNPFTYLLSAKYEIADDAMIYGRVASGYRAGGPNGSGCVAFGYACSFAPDRTVSYELGAKGNIARMFSWDASLYIIDWNDIQLFAVDDSGLGYSTNGARARSQGFELSADIRPTSGLTLSVNGNIGSAKLTEDLPSEVVANGAYGVDGDRLPFSSKFSGRFAINQSFAVGNARAYIEPAVSYEGRRVGIFTAQGSPRQVLPAYTRVDLRVGIQTGPWAVDIFANNLFDKRGIINAGSALFPTTAIQYTQPRTIGINIRRDF